MPEYCNAALSVVRELYTAQFQCSSPLFPLGNTKLIKFGHIAKSIYLKVIHFQSSYSLAIPCIEYSNGIMHAKDIDICSYCNFPIMRLISSANEIVLPEISLAT